MGRRRERHRRRPPPQHEAASMIPRSLASDFAIWRRLLRETRSHWFHLTGALAFSLLATPLMLLTPLPLKIAVDSVIGTDPLPGSLASIMPEDARGSDIALLLVLAVLLLLFGLLLQLHRLRSYYLRSP